MTNILNNDALLFWATNFFLLVATIGGGWVYFRSQPSPFVKRMTWVLLGVVAFLAVMEMLAWSATILPDFGQWFFNIDRDRNAPSIFAAVQWMLLSLLFAANSFARDIPRLQRGYWALIAIVFFLISVDDYYAIHETIVVEWRQAYLQAAIVFGAINLLAFWFWFRKDFRRNPWPFVLAGIGFVILGISGFFVEDYLYGACSDDGSGLLCSNFRQFTAIEEVFEMLGVVILLAGLLLYSQEKFDPPRWKWATRLLVVGGMVWLGVLLAYMWVLPTIEAQFATPAHIEFEDGELELVSYWLPDTTLEPGEQVNVLMYWRADRKLPRDYRLSMHLVTQPDGESLASSNQHDVGQYPSAAWIPGLTMRKVMQVTVPKSAETPAAYWLTARVWYGDLERSWTDTIGLTVNASENRLMMEDTLILANIAALSNDTPEAVAVETAYHFTEGFHLTGYTVPEAATLGEDLEMKFRWQTDHNINMNMVTFIHLFHEESDAYIVRDWAPFARRFPTADWPAGVDVVDTVRVRLPDDAPPGTYRLHVGMYDDVNQERRPVNDESGTPVQDYSIPLTTITLHAPPPS